VQMTELLTGLKVVVYDSTVLNKASPKVIICWDGTAPSHASLGRLVKSRFSKRSGACPTDSVVMIQCDKIKCKKTPVYSSG